MCLKRLNLIVSCCLFCLLANAQKIVGSVKDTNTTKALGFVQVAAKNSNGKIIGGTITNADGKFELANNFDTKFTLTFSYLGYKSYATPLLNPKTNIELKSVWMKNNAEELGTVEIEGRKLRTAVRSTIEGLEINPNDNLGNSGGSVLDILRNTPSVTVSDDGSVSIRGSNGTNVLINGRNSVLGEDLEQIPASAIKKIRVITNPNAKYDAQASGGILDIQLKKTGDEKRSLKLNTSIGNNYRLNTGIRFTENKSDWAYYVGYNFRRWPRKDESNFLRENFETGEKLQQEAEYLRKDLEHTINFGADIYKKHGKFSLESAVSIENEDDFEFRQNQFLQTDDANDINYVRTNNEVESNYGIDNALIYVPNFSDSLRDFKIVLSHSYRNGEENQYISTYDNSLQANPNALSKLNRTTNPTQQHNVVFTSDYNQNIGAYKLETGVKNTFRHINNDYIYEDENIETGEYDLRTDVSNTFEYQDNVAAVYGILSRSIKQFKLSAGLRAEQTNLTTRVVQTNEVNEQNYLNFFPSVQSLFSQSENTTYKASYSRRVNRPNARRLNPFPDVSDTLNIRIGNPQLLPEYINSFELGVIKKMGRWDVTATAFYRHINNKFDYLINVVDGVTFRGPANLNESQEYGVELIYGGRIAKSASLSGGISFFGVSVDGSNVDQDFVNTGIGYNAKTTIDLALPKNINFQVNANYTSPEVEAQGRDLARYYIDLSAQRSFFKDDKLNVSLSLQDAFNLRQFSGVNSSNGYRQSFTYNRQTRFLILGLSYKILG